MKKFLKWAGIAAGVLLILFVGFVVAIFVMLPTPSEIGRKLRVQRTAPAVAVEPAVAAEPAAEPVVQINPAESKVEVTAKPTDDKTLSVASERDREILMRLMDPRQPRTRFCEYLGQPSTASQKLSSEQFGRLFVAHMGREQKHDPAMEAMLPILRQVFDYPEMRRLVEVTGEAAAAGDTGFMQKAQFYGMVYAAYQRLSAESASLEKTSDRAYHLFMMARALDRRPELRNDPVVRDYCQQVQTAMNSKVAFGEDEERRGFQDFLERIRVPAEEIGYDPNYRTKLEMLNDPGALSFSGGWLDQWIADE